MTNFKLYFKLLKKHMVQQMIYFIFFILIFVANESFNHIEEPNQYQIYIVGNKKSSICQEIKTYLENKKGAKVIFLEVKEKYRLDSEREEALERLIDEAVLTDVASCVIKVAEEGQTRIEIFTNLDDAISLDIEQTVEAALQKDGSYPIEKETRIAYSEIDKKHENIRSYLNIGIYGLSTLICVGIISVSASMNKRQIKERRSCAPTEEMTERDLLKYHFFLGFIINAILFLPVYYFDWTLIFSTEGLLLGINTLLVSGNLVLIGYLLSIFIHNLSLEMAAVNVVSLVTLFMSGTVQEQWEVSELALRIGSFMPTFWYVKANNLITMKALSQQNSHREILETMMIEVLFFIALYIIGLIARTQKSEEEER